MSASVTQRAVIALGVALPLDAAVSVGGMIVGWAVGVWMMFNSVQGALARRGDMDACVA